MSDVNESINTKSIEGKTILVVEDDKFLSGILELRLRNAKVDVMYAKTGEEALDAIGRKVPHAILLDILLPGISGLEVLKTIRSKPETEKTPVIVISNFSESTQIEKANALGASYLVKALVTPDDILNAVVNLF